ncbi:hypothetical protein GCM10009117_01250 [Gangjinia marincola]|uniref:Uncharacterized protein n=1 Tax=Gangjinia marincola TaxID=578463 RepID=A0ABP3XNT8_9FLAO
MKKFATILLFVLTLSGTILSTSCREQTAGENVEEAAEDIGDGVEDAADEIED